MIDIEALRNEVDSLLRNIDNPKNEEKKKLSKNGNIIGSMVVHKNNKEAPYMIYSLLTKQSRELDRLYLWIEGEEDDVEYSIYWMLNYFGDKIEYKFIEDVDLFDNLRILNGHDKDNVFIFNEHILYDEDTIMDVMSIREERCLIGLSRDEYHKRRIYDDGVKVYTRADNSQLMVERNNIEKSNRNQLTEDMFIPSYMIDEEIEDLDKLRDEYYNDWELYWTIEGYKNEWDVKYYEKNWNNVVSNDEMKLVKYLKIHEEILKGWCEKYPGYSIENNENISTENIEKGTISVAMISFNIPEMVVENLNCIHRKLLKMPKEVVVLDNTVKDPYKLYEAHWISYIRKDIRNTFRYWDNTGNERFVRILPKRDEKPYGFYLYQQSVKYLLENIDCDYLFIFNEKCKMDKTVYFDDRCVLNYYGNYLKIFNKKLMKENEITFDTFEQFYRDIARKKLKIEEMNIEKKLMVLPEDFDKYNGMILAGLHYREHIMTKWLNEKYHKGFEHVKYWNH